MDSGKVHHVGTFTLMDNINASSDYTSNSININGFVLYSIQFSWSAFSAPACTIYTEGSNDGEVWTSIDAFVPFGITGSRLLNVEKAAYAQVRVRYVQSGGAGAIKAILNGKVA